MTKVPIDVSIVAVYRLAVSMPMSGAALKDWHFGAEPSNGGKGVDIVGQATADYCEPMSDVQPEPVDLAAIEADLEAVETALQRLDAGTYWTDEITGETLPDDVLRADPLTRRLPQ